MADLDRGGSDKRPARACGYAGSDGVDLLEAVDTDSRELELACLLGSCCECGLTKGVEKIGDEG